MSIFSRFRKAEQDALEYAHQVAHGALGIFDQVTSDLAHAVAVLETTVIPEAEERIAAAGRVITASKERVEEALNAAAKHTATIAKVNALTGTPGD